MNGSTQAGAGKAPTPSPLGMTPQAGNIPPMEYRDTTEAAKALGVTRRRVLAMLQSGVLKGRKHGDMWLIKQSDIDELVKKRSAKSPAN